MITKNKKFQLIADSLISLKSENLEKFTKKLDPNVKHSLGVSIPNLRLLVKNIKNEHIEEFIQDFEENYVEFLLMKAIAIGRLGISFFRLNEIIISFLHKINCWMVCDIFCLSLKSVRKFRADTIEHLKEVAKDCDEFKQRYVAVMLLAHFLTDDYIDTVFEMLDSLECKEYYTEMAIGWAVATAFVKQREKALIYLSHNKLSDRSHNFAIRKIRESSRVSKDDKQLVKNYVR